MERISLWTKILSMFLSPLKLWIELLKKLMNNWKWNNEFIYLTLFWLMSHFWLYFRSQIISNCEIFNYSTLIRYHPEVQTQFSRTALYGDAKVALALHYSLMLKWLSHWIIRWYWSGLSNALFAATELALALHYLLLLTLRRNIGNWKEIIMDFRGKETSALQLLYPFSAVAALEASPTQGEQGVFIQRLCACAGPLHSTS